MKQVAKVKQKTTQTLIFSPHNWRITRRSLRGRVGKLRGIYDPDGDMVMEHCIKPYG